MCVIYVLVLPPSKPAETTKLPGFVDVASRSRITYKSNNSLTGRKYFPQPMCGGIAVFDYDNDGRLDIFFTNGAKFPEMRKVDRSFYNCLLHQKADGTFEDGLAQIWTTILASPLVTMTMTDTKTCSSPAQAKMCCTTTMEMAHSRM
jgi:hypothetical protein